MSAGGMLAQIFGEVEDQRGSVTIEDPKRSSNDTNSLAVAQVPNRHQFCTVS
jgi:hypothetical protein